MVNMLSSLVLPLLPIISAVIAAVYWWRNLSYPWLFLVVSLLALFGVQAILFFVMDTWPQLIGNSPHPNNFIGGIAPSEVEIQKAFDERHRTALIKAAMIVVLAVPLLWWLKAGLASK